MSAIRYLARFTMMTAALAVAALFVGGCNTLQGLGEDLSAAGEGLADVAEDIAD